MKSQPNKTRSFILFARSAAQELFASLGMRFDQRPEPNHSRQVMVEIFASHNIKSSGSQPKQTRAGVLPT